MCMACLQCVCFVICNTLMQSLTFVCSALPHMPRPLLLETARMFHSCNVCSQCMHKGLSHGQAHRWPEKCVACNSRTHCNAPARMAGPAHGWGLHMPPNPPPFVRATPHRSGSSPGAPSPGLVHAKNARWHARLDHQASGLGRARWRRRRISSLPACSTITGCTVVRGKLCMDAECRSIFPPKLLQCGALSTSTNCKKSGCVTADHKKLECESPWGFDLFRTGPSRLL